jgi:hypothetical protein
MRATGRARLSFVCGCPAAARDLAELPVVGRGMLQLIIAWQCYRSHLAVSSDRPSLVAWAMSGAKEILLQLCVCWVHSCERQGRRQSDCSWRGAVSFQQKICLVACCSR